ncbi:MAG: hypothetical protein HFG44_08485 [Oscillospiraceae bacterium]|jgi:hypothetical protein|nr:hypothetical protein [Oscillospiraceae bacterium]
MRFLLVFSIFLLLCGISGFLAVLMVLMSSYRGNFLWGMTGLSLLSAALGALGLWFYAKKAK